MSNPITPPASGNPLHDLYGKLPRGWEAWRGVSGLLYARKRRSSPPVVLRDVSADGLARKVADWEREHSQP
jgi:hypothetical protein